MSTRYSARGYGRDYGRYDREDYYGGRYGRGPEDEYERGYAGREERDFPERAGDEVRSWFGDEEAARRRRMDEGRGWYGGYGSEYDRYGGGGFYGRSNAASGLEGGFRESSILVRLGDTDFDITGEDDIRGRRVIDESGNDIGHVDDLIVDQRRRRARFLQVTSGGFLGIGGTMLLVPVEAVTNVGRDEITVSQRGGRAMGAMRFNPSIIDRSEYRGEYGGYYGGYAERGRHRGRGPRGYKRSDDRIREDINDRLSDDPIIDASEVEVSVANGEVTLNGAVNSRSDKRRAEDLAEMMSGVTHVQNNLRVRQREFGTTAGATSGTTTGTATGTAAGTTQGTTTTGARRGTAAGGITG